MFTEFAVLQGGARPGAGELRTHRIAVGVYDDDGSGKLVRTHRIELDVTGERTEVPELVGVHRGKLVLVNDDDLTLLHDAARPGLAGHADRPDRRHRRAAAAHAVLVGGVGDDPRGRAEGPRLRERWCWRGLHAESEVGVVQRLLLQAQTALSSYADDSWRAEGWRGSWPRRWSWHRPPSRAPTTSWRS